MTQLHLDLQNPGDRVEPVWTFGGIVRHAPLLLRKDVQRHLQMGRDELGFRHVRCGGLLSDDMGVMGDDGSFDLTRVEAALDALMENHCVPFLDLSQVPRALAPRIASDELGPYFELFQALAQRVDSRFGCDANEWYFQLGGVTGPGSGREHLRLYDLAAKAIKQVSPALRVGTAVEGDPARLDELLQHVRGTSEEYGLEAPRCDFVCIDPRVPPEDVRAARGRVTELLGETVPLIYSRQSEDGGTVADDCNAAAAVARTMAESVDLVQGAVLWTLSDIDDDAARACLPFRGGAGLITVNDVRKASFNAMRLLREQSGYHTQRVPVWWTDPFEGLGCLATKEEYTLRLLLWYARDAGAAAAQKTAVFTVEGLAESIQFGQVEVIRPAAGSPYEAWVQLGRPQHVNREILDALEDAAHPAVAEVNFREYPPRLEPGMVMQLTVPLPYDEPAWA